MVPMRRPDALLLFLGVSLLPVYVFGSGGVQPSHLLLACFAGFTIFNEGLPVISVTLLLLALFLHAFAVESVYSMAGGDPRMIINSIFILYNFLLVSAIYAYCRRHGLGVLVPGTLIAAMIALATVVTTGVDLRDMGEGGRPTGTFNNPNQLGYFSVCLLSLTYLFYREKHLRYSVAVGLFGIALFLAIASLSKAAMVANFAVGFFALKPGLSRNSILVWVIGALGAAAALAILYQRGAFDDYLFMQRLQNMANESDSSLESRGYFAFLQGNAIQMMFGLGNGLVDEIVGHEVHSTLASFLNNYGVVGLVLFLIMVLVWLLHMWRAYGIVGMISIAGPPLLYGITHNGSRFTIFWLLVAASMATAQRLRLSKPTRHASAIRRAAAMQRCPRAKI